MEPICTGFRCNIGQCIPQNRVCDGIPDCRGGEDEDARYCKEFEESCENSVDSCSKCYDNLNISRNFKFLSLLTVQ